MQHSLRRETLCPAAMTAAGAPAMTAGVRVPPHSAPHARHEGGCVFRFIKEIIDCFDTLEYVEMSSDPSCFDLP